MFSFLYDKFRLCNKTSLTPIIEVMIKFVITTGS